MPSKHTSLSLAFALAVGLGLAHSTSAPAAEVQAGTVIDASNIDSMSNNTFEGRRIGDMINDVNQRLVREFSNKIKLGEFKPHPRDSRSHALTDKYRGTAKFNPETRQVEGYIAGVPFPDLSMDDPHVGYKLIFNLINSNFLGDNLHWPASTWFFVGPGGYERSITYEVAVYNMTGRRTNGDNHIEGDGTIRTLTTLIAIQPFDVRGLGTFAIRYTDGRYDDVYAYLRAVRRWRRLSGSAWYDPIQGSDFLGDETTNGFNVAPHWYEGYKILEKKDLLFAATEQKYYYVDGKKELHERVPFVAMQTPPYWNTNDPKESWRRRTVYVVEAIPPKGHPMSRRIAYVDANPHWPVCYQVDNYDQAGQLWHVYNQVSVNTVADDGAPIVDPIFARVIDPIAMRASMIPGSNRRSYNTPGVTAEDFNLEAITRKLQ